ncbi:MAG: alpha/beta fold hydrolase [Dehalococcoidales bacterium]|nr:alpha/beta fold hydrolase [Dehalococcoidales bacterium]
MPKARVNGIELFYEVHGQGYPVVLAHGFSSSHEAWQPQVEVFSREYRFITYDARGHGQSTSPPSPDQYSPDIVAEDLRQLLGVLDVKKAVVGGISMGGYESLSFYLNYPEMVTALILADTGPGYRNPARREEWNRQYEERVKVIEAEGKHPPGVIHMARKVVMQHDSRVIESLDKIKVPTLLLVGENDTPYLAAGEYMAKVIPGAKHVVIPDAGHSCNRDNPEFFSRTVLDFLKKLNLPQD